MRYLIIDVDKLNIHPEIANQIIDAYLWQHNYLKSGIEFPVLSEEETLAVFKSCYDAGYETGASTYNDDYHGIPIEFDEFKKTL